MFDMSFIPDEMVFDDDFRYVDDFLADSFIVPIVSGSDEATAADMSTPYKGLDFATDVRFSPLSRYTR